MRKKHGRDDTNRLAWTPLALAYTTGGLLLIGLGAALDVVYLVILGALLIMGVILDAARTLGRLPRTRLEVSPERIPEDSAAEVHIHAERVGPRHQIWVDLTPGLRLSPSCSNILERRSREQDEKFDVIAKVRGPQRVGPVIVREWSPLSLWASDRTVERPRLLEVIPRAEDASNIALASRILKPMQGRFQVNRPGQGMDFFALREYEQGDSIRSINWKASARVDELIVNQRQRETHSQILLLLDSRIVTGLGPLGQTPLDRGCRLTLGLFKDALNARDTLLFYTYGDQVQGLTDAPSGQRLMALETLLARLPAAGTAPLRRTWEEIRTRLTMNAPVILITPAEGDPTLDSTVGDMVARGHPVTVISPTPVGHDWEEDPQRRKRREQTIEAVRDRGAVLFDWNPEMPAHAEKPVQIKTVA